MTRWVFLLGLFLCAPPVAAAPDIQDLLNAFNGNFDSKMQWDVEDGANLLERDRHPWTMVVHTPVPNSPIGPNVFYVEEFRDANAAKVVRQRIVSFAAEGTTVRMTQFALKDPAKVRGAFRAPEKLTRLGADDVTPMPGCDVLWRYDPGEFWDGAIPGKTCAASASGRPRYVQYRVTLSYPLYHRVDRELFADTEDLAAGFADELPTVHARVRYVP